MSGITTTGFSPATLQQIKDAIEADMQARFGAAKINFSSSGVLGTVDGIVAAKLQEIWEVMAAVYASGSPDQAVGAALDNICALCPGITRIPAAKTVIPAHLSLNGHTTVPAGSLVHPEGIPDWQFATTVAVSNDGDDPAVVDAELEATDYGERTFTTDTLVIDTPVTGWTAAARNPSGTYLAEGRATETDAELRERREEMLRATGGANPDAIRARVLDADTTNIVDVAVYHNDTDDIVDGMQPHSVRVVVHGDTVDEAAVAVAIWEAVAGGIYTNGAVIKTVEDDRGYDQTVRFDYAIAHDIYVHYDSPTSTVTDSAPANWVDLVNDKLVALISDLEIGEDVIFQQLLTGVMLAYGVGAAGGWLVDLDAFGISTTPSGYGDGNIAIAEGYVARLTADHIDDGAP